MLSIDIVIPLYNGEKWIKQTIDSIKNQSHPPNRIIVIDDHSTDDSLAVVQSLEGVEVFINPSQTGRCASARNYGLEHATSDLVSFVDQDDLFHEHHYKWLIEILCSHPEAVAAASYHTTFEEPAVPQYEVDDRSCFIDEMWRNFPFSDFAEPSLIIFRREVFNNTEWYEKHPGIADHFIWHELTLTNTIYRMNARTVGRRIHPESYYEQLAKDPVALLEDTIVVNEDLIKRVLPKIKDPKQKDYMIRHKAVTYALIDLAKDIKSLSPAFKEKMLNLTNQLLEETDHFRLYTVLEIWKATRQVIYYYKKDDPFLTMKFIHKNWPKNRCMLLKVIDEKIILRRPGLKFYVSYCLKNPLKVRSWNLFFKAILMKLKIYRTTDKPSDPVFL